MTEDKHASETPDAQPSLRARRRAGLGPIVAASVLAGVLLVALVALWVSGGQLTGLLLGSGGGVDAEKVEVDARTYKSYFTVERKLAGPRGRTLVVTLKRAKGFPLKDADFERISEATPGIAGLLAFEAVARGYVRCEYFGEKEEFLGFTLERIRDLCDREVVELSLPVAGRRGLRRIVFTY
ncbi:MAG TPA: hypothetical protein VNE39_04645 [Planctomycetota bacterium]|nr:hypothetical protein [Planctomycetota bacterium]